MGVIKKQMLFVVVTFLSSSAVFSQLPAGIDTTANWYLHWQDEFDYPDDELEDTWISADKQSGGLLLCTRYRENCEVHDGILEITARKVDDPENNEGNDWTAGSIWTKSNDFKYGYYEAKYKYAAATGTNNSFWLYPYSTADAGYNKVELDINEGRFPNIIKTNMHNWTAGDTEVHPVQKYHYVDTESDLGSEYHTYGLLWTPTEHIIYVDGEEIRREANPAYLQKNPANTNGAWVYVENHSKTQILLSLAILPPYYSGPIVEDELDGASMKVDYVRYYKNDDLILNLVEDAKNNMEVYPNPTTSKLFFTDSEKIETVEIFNLHGQIIVKQSNDIESGVDVSYLKSGLYYYKTIGHNKSLGMFIKE